MKFRIFFTTFVVLLIAQAACAQCIKKPAPAAAAKEENPYDYIRAFPFSKRLLSDKDKELLLKEGSGEPGDLATFARAVIFGKHGREFRDRKVKNLLTGETWYKPNPKFSNSMLNSLERQNLDIVRGVEADTHEHYVEPGDLRFWKDRDISPKGLTASRIELHVMKAEIEAIHGKKFEDEPWLQKYFEDRYWYKASAHYDPKSLNAHERSNIALLGKLEAKKTGAGLSPGDLLTYGEKPIEPKLLAKLNLYELRLLRNEVYAIRGARFHTAWIQDHFDNEEWYSPLPAGKKPQLSAVDERNVALILKKENELHLALSTTKLKNDDLEGMMSDDAARLRDEIYARRGKVFKSKWLQGYFASLPWYKADPKFSEKSLTGIERSNIKLIAKYEKKAREQEDMTEG